MSAGSRIWGRVHPSPSGGRCSLARVDLTVGWQYGDSSYSSYSSFQQLTATAVIQRAKDPGCFLFLSPILRFHGFSYSNPGNTERKPASPGVVVRMLSLLSHSAVHMYVCTCTYLTLRVIPRTALVLRIFSMTAVAVTLLKTAVAAVNHPAISW